MQQLCCGATYSLAVIGSHTLTRNEVLAHLRLALAGPARLWLPQL